MGSRLLTKIVAVLITVVLLLLLSTQIAPEDIIITLKNINPVYLVSGFILYTGTYVFRAWRFHILLNKEVSIKDLFFITCVHNMMNNLLPARTGELSYIYLLKTRQKKTTGEGLATLIIARIFDFMVISFFFLVLFLSIDNLIPGAVILVVTGVLFLLFMVFLLLGVLFYGNVLLKIFEKFAYSINFKNFRAGDYILNKGKDTFQCFEKFKNGSMNLHLSVIFLSIGIWVLSYALFYVIAVSMNIQLDAVQILFASSFAVFSSVLPIQGIGGFGTMEGGWALGFVAVGVTKEVAIYTGFGFHLIILLYTLLLGTIGYLAIHSEDTIKKSL